ncbi:GNAT family N-acetyltransferase [Micromonospora sp. DT4]|uniref:GNAT family N-acetyltransferase n=1 Tax=Micromonospora sp. DT4 TaxID=3393438 RepID=UPI003CE7E4A4
MNLFDHFGLPIIEATADEAMSLSGDFPEPRAALVRVLDPPVDSWAALGAAGFIVKPAWVTWLARIDDEQSDLLTRSSRQVNRAWRRAEKAGLRIEVQESIQEEHLDTFFDLYEKRIEEMAYGVAFARQAREEILHGGQDYAVFAFDGDRMVGGCLCQRSPEFDVVRVRFSAVELVWREASLPRVLYTRAFDVAREDGFHAVTMGNDPNLYGHMTKPGLFHFKARLGFDPVPAGSLGPRFGGDVADRLLSLDRLTDPTVMLGYADLGEHLNPARADLVTYVFGSNPLVDSDRFRTPRVQTVRTVEWPTGSSTLA